MYDISPAAKMLFKAGDTRKEYTFKVLNDDGTTDFTINNETLVAESVSIDERMASTSELRFGLCEGASLEFQYFDHPNIKGRRLDASIMVYYERENPWSRYSAIYWDPLHPDYSSIRVNETRPIRIVIPAHTPGELMLYSGISTTRKRLWIINNSANEQIIQNISEFESGDTFRYYFEYYGGDDPNPVEIQYYRQYGAYEVLMGHFTVSGCARQASTGIYKVTAYNKLKSEYLDARANDLLKSQYAATTSIMVADIERTLLKDYMIKNDIDIPVSSVTGVTGTDSFYLNIPFLFTALYGIEAPINAKEYSVCRTPSLSTPLYFGFESYAATYETTGYNDWIISELAGKMEDFEKNIKKRIEYLIDSAVLGPGSYPFPIPYLDDVIAGRDFTHYLLLQDYWKYICCIEVTQGGETKRYSTAIWKDEEYHQTTHTVAGTFNDLIGKTQFGPATIKVITPYCMNMRGFEDEQTATTVDYCFGSQQSFIYYTNAQQDTATINVPPIKYGDGVTDYEALLPDYNIGEAMRVGYPLYSKAEKQTVFLTADYADFTLRDILTADYETQCMFGQLTRRTDRFRGVELNGGGLYPAETLYPANTKYPNGTPLKKGIHPYPNEYMQLWTDDTEELVFRNLYITYRNGNKEYVLEKEINADGNTDYYVNDNWLFKNLHWQTSEVESIAEDMASKMQNIRWVPFQMELAGLPYVEAGDAIEIVYRDGITRNSYILQRQLSGIQNLQDTYANGQLDIF